MHDLRRLLAVAGVALFIASSAGASAQPVGTTTDLRTQAFAQADKPSVVTRVKTWTRARLDAAKKRWAESQEKFTDCQRQLAAQQKTKRLSLHRQGHFLERCMNRKP